MKLRNKKTGKIYNACNICFGESLDDLEKTKWKTLKEFCEEWEDYAPKEPLIKDEKIRKAVKAWADANDLDGASYYKSSHLWYLRSFNDHEQAIDFWLSYNAEPEMIENKYYTIAELCGEEEE